MKLEYPKELDEMLAGNPNLDVLIVSVVFDTKEPMTKKKKRELANSVYQAALKQLDTLNSTEKLLPSGEKGNKFPPKLPRD